jgi:hypothetical protein
MTEQFDLAMGLLGNDPEFNDFMAARKAEYHAMTPTDQDICWTYIFVMAQAFLTLDATVTTVLAMQEASENSIN